MRKLGYYWVKDISGWTTALLCRNGTRHGDYYWKILDGYYSIVPYNYFPECYISKRLKTPEE